MIRRFILLFSPIFFILLAHLAQAETREYIIYDGQSYAPNQLESAASSPLPVVPPTFLVEVTLCLVRQMAITI
jgi:hypothetical protein